MTRPRWPQPCASCCGSSITSRGRGTSTGAACRGARADRARARGGWAAGARRGAGGHRRSGERSRPGRQGRRDPRRPPARARGDRAGGAAARGRQLRQVGHQRRPDPGSSASRRFPGRTGWSKRSPAGAASPRACAPPPAGCRRAAEAGAARAPGCPAAAGPDSCGMRSGATAHGTSSGSAVASSVRTVHPWIEASSSSPRTLTSLRPAVAQNLCRSPGEKAWTSTSPSSDWPLGSASG